MYVSGYQPRMFQGRTAIGLTRTLRDSLRQSEQISAKKNLFLETGWYRPSNRIPVSTKGFFVCKKEKLWK
jgi:hypothetical protein